MSAEPPPLSLVTSVADDTVTFVLAGEIDLHNSTEVNREFTSISPALVRLFDMTGLTELLRGEVE